MLESRQLLTTPTFGWTLNAAGVRPVVWVNANGSSLVSSPAFNAENLNLPTGSFNTSKGTDGSGRKTFGPASGLPADGNYEFTLPASSFASGGTDVQATDFFVNGDVNHDRSVDSSDGYILYQNSYGGGTKSFAQGDLDGDSDVDSADFAIVGSRYGTRLAPAPTYEGEVTVSSLAVQADGTTPLVVNWGVISDYTVQNSDPSNANKTVAGYTVYRSTDSTTFTHVADVMRITTSEPSVYGYTDPTPVDGTKYWYRIRPFYAVTQPDGSSGFQHLPTTNKAWRVSAILAPTYVDAVVASDSVFISWTDQSANETGFRIEMLDDGDWNEVGTVPANSRSFSMSAGLLGDTLQFRVTSIQDDLSIDSAPTAVTAIELGEFTADELASDVSYRVNVNEQTVGFEYNAGEAHANETIVVEELDSGTGFTPGVYTLNSLGIVTLPISISATPTSIRRLQILFPNDRQAILPIGPEPFDYGGRADTMNPIVWNPTTGRYEGGIIVTFPRSDGLPDKIVRPVAPAIGVTPGTPAVPLPTSVTVGTPGTPTNGEIPVPVTITFPPAPPPPAHGSYEVPIDIVGIDGTHHGVIVTISF